MGFFRCFASEGIKLKRSLIGWLLLGGGLFTPIVVIAARLRRPALLAKVTQDPAFWTNHWTQSWQSIALLILPVMVILVATVVIQIEYRNNTWKQVHASPQPLLTIYLAKLTWLLGLLVALFGILELGTYASGILPPLLAGAPLPSGQLPLSLIAERGARFFVDCLPILALQLGLAIWFKNFLVPLGFGMAAWILGLATVSTDVNYLIPYAYLGMDHYHDEGRVKLDLLPANLQALSAVIFGAVLVGGYVAYVNRSERG